ncbi:MAG: hypothetical protein A4E42_02408 [Methanoregulaceae archaeon PtaU1.Bin222]|jgi:uncharacterized membrane protein|nr:MAG: hypothetical protein A4E42_02408 [Methanoregulaceae archaeon PtaU1.Bin222]
MKQNTFYFLTGIIGLAEVGFFWISVVLRNPAIIVVTFILGVLLIYASRRTISDRTDDERSALITQKAGARTLEIFWILFFAISLGSLVMGFATPLGIPPPPKPFPRVPHDEPNLGYFGLLQMILLCGMVFLYIGFRVYYARKYGEWDKDEE